MNRLKYIYILCLMLTALFAACDVVSEEDQHINMITKLEGSHLIIEFTGVNCVNCPQAAAEAHRLLEKYPENVIVVEMHPASNPFTEAKAEYDYTCDAADKYYKMFGGTSSTPFPKGVVNFRKFGGEYFQDHDNWETLLSNSVVDSISEVGKTICWLVEDSIVGAQADGNTINLEYVHNHVLRAEVEDINATELKENQYFVVVSFDDDGNYLRAEKVGANAKNRTEKRN